MIEKGEWPEGRVFYRVAYGRIHRMVVLRVTEHMVVYRNSRWVRKSMDRENWFPSFGEAKQFMVDLKRAEAEAATVSLKRLKGDLKEREQMTEEHDCVNCVGAAEDEFV
jgi:hypothetical protein